MPIPKNIRIEQIIVNGVPSEKKVKIAKLYRDSPDGFNQDALVERADEVRQQREVGDVVDS